MKVEFAGRIINKGVSKKSGKPFAQVLVPKADNSGSDVVLVMTKKEYQLNADVKIFANAFISVCSEV